MSRNPTAPAEWDFIPVSGINPLTIRGELEFLYTVNLFPYLYTDTSVLDLAIRRYEQFWMPLLGKEPPSVYTTPPLDIHWVWHCHMLCPQKYRTDSVTLAGRVVDHSIKAPDVIPAQSLWQTAYPGEPFEHPNKSVLGPPVDYKQRSSYNLKEACIRQGTFFYNVSFPHYMCTNFLESAIRRYRKMLYLKKMYPKKFLVPCYDFDLVWHVHQLHPDIYYSDTTEYLGFLFPHDDTDTDRSLESKLTQADLETRELWVNTFGESFAMSGCMWRGPPPQLKLTPFAEDKAQSLQCRIATVSIQSVSVEQCPSRKITLKFYIDGALRRKRKILADVNLVAEYVEGCVVNFDTGLDSYVRVELISHQKTLCCTSLTSEGILQRPLAEQIISLDTVDKSPRPVENFSTLLGSTKISAKADLRFKGFGPIILRLNPGNFETVTMPENVEQLWGPIPLARLPADVPNKCLVASHKLIPKGATSALLTARVIHCLPLMMSVVQIFMGDKMLCVAHLVGTDQLPDSKSETAISGGTPLHLNWSQGERALLIKDARGDWGIVFGKWINMKKGVPSDRAARRAGVPGSPGNLHITVKNVDGLTTTDIDVGTKNITFRGNEIDLKSGKILINSAFEQTPEFLALTFAISILNVLVQPPPPGYIQPTAHTGTTVTKPYYSRSEGNRGTRSVNYVHSGDLAFVAAAGWLMATPSNYYIHHHIHAGACGGGGFSGCGGGCGAMDVGCDAIGGGCGGDGGDGGDGGGGCGGCGAGCGAGGGGGGGGGGDGGGGDGGGGGCGGGGCGGGCGGCGG